MLVGMPAALTERQAQNFKRATSLKSLESQSSSDFYSTSGD